MRHWRTAAGFSFGVVTMSASAFAQTMLQESTSGSFTFNTTSTIPFTGTASATITSTGPTVASDRRISSGNNLEYTVWLTPPQFWLHPPTTSTHALDYAVLGSTLNNSSNITMTFVSPNGEGLAGSFPIQTTFLGRGPMGTGPLSFSTVLGPSAAMTQTLPPALAADNPSNLPWLRTEQVTWHADGTVTGSGFLQSLACGCSVPFTLAGTFTAVNPGVPLPATGLLAMNITSVDPVTGNWLGSVAEGLPGDPGSPLVAGTGATLPIPLNREITTTFLPTNLAPVSDGYVEIMEPTADGGTPCISDIAIFWNGSILPGATVLTADRVLVISDDPKNDDGGTGNSCLSDYDIQRVNGHPQYQAAFQGAGITTLQGLLNQINLRTSTDGGPPPLGAPVIVAETSASLADGGTADNTSFTATNGLAVSQTYQFLDPPNGAEQVPALPRWATVLFGGALVLPGLYFAMRSRRLVRGSAAG